MTAFAAEHGRIAWLSGRGTIYLDALQADGLLDIFGEAEGGAALFNQLHEAIADLSVQPLAPIPELKPITARCVALDPDLWPPGSLEQAA